VDEPCGLRDAAKLSRGPALLPRVRRGRGRLVTASSCRKMRESDVVEMSCPDGALAPAVGGVCPVGAE